MDRREEARDQARAAAEAERTLTAMRAADRLNAAEKEWARAREEYRQAVVALYLIDRQSQTEIAGLVGRSQSSISNLLQKGK